MVTRLYHENPHRGRVRLLTLRSVLFEFASIRLKLRCPPVHSTPLSPTDTFTTTMLFSHIFMSFTRTQTKRTEGVKTKENQSVRRLCSVGVTFSHRQRERTFNRKEQRAVSQDRFSTCYIGIKRPGSHCVRHVTRRDARIVYPAEVCTALAKFCKFLHPVAPTQIVTLCGWFQLTSTWTQTHVDRQMTSIWKVF